MLHDQVLGFVVVVNIVPDEIPCSPLNVPLVSIGMMDCDARIMFKLWPDCGNDLLVDFDDVDMHHAGLDQQAANHATKPEACF